MRTHELEALKDENLSKDKLLITEQFEVSALAKRLDQRAAEVEATRRLLADASEAVARQASELGSTAGALRRADADALSQKRAYDALVAERDALAAALTRRNDEMALLHEKCSIQAITLAKGERVFADVSEEARAMRLKVAELKRDLANASASSTGSGAELRKQLAAATKDLNAEQAKVRARARAPSPVKLNANLNLPPPPPRCACFRRSSKTR